MTNIKLTKDQLENTLKAHSALKFYTCIIFLIFSVSALMGVLSVTNGFTQNDLFNWIILGLCMLLTLGGGLCFFISAIQTLGVEKKILQYYSDNNLDAEIVSLTTSIKLTFFLLAGATFGAQFLALLL